MPEGGDTPPDRPAPLHRAVELSGDELRLELEVPADLPCFAGHFPGRPLLPGYVLFDWALESAMRAWNLPASPVEARSIKFLSPVLPGDLLTLVSTRSAGSVSYRYERSGSKVASGAFSLCGPE